jgi:pimeloyl-ACP methyl ester carboxylesterase
MLRSLAAALAVLCLLMHTAPQAAASEKTPAFDVSLSVKHRQVEIDGVRIFYREAGCEDPPAILLMHGFPASSHMFRHLMPALANRFHLIAPDCPGFGLSDSPVADKFEYSFAHYAELMDRFTRPIGLKAHALYIQDYGAPIGLCLAMRVPERVTGLIVQNGNAYAEGLSDGWDPLKAYWRDPTSENREKLRDRRQRSGLQTRSSRCRAVSSRHQPLRAGDAPAGCGGADRAVFRYRQGNAVTC